MARYSCLIIFLVSVQANAKEIGRLVKAPETHAHETLRSRMQEVEANVHASGEHATVSFAHEGQHHHYSLMSHKVYSEGAQIFEGGKRIETPGRTFRSREQGRWASMTVHSNGKITGLFEHKGVMMEIQPVAHQDRKVAHALLANYTGKHPAHLIKNIVLEEVVDATRTARRLLTKPTTESENPTGKNNNNIPSAGNNIVPNAAQTTSQWGGVPWFPGCYTGDNQQHIFEIGLSSDQAALEMYPTDLKSKLESIVNDASLVYEHQMNIKLQIGYSYEMGSNYGACPTADDDICTDRLSQTRNFLKDGTLPFKGAVHHFTGCGKSWGVMGLAYVDAICNTVAGGAYNCGSNKLAGSSPWLTFAHELGHNFNGKHSFENGQGTTGGIMDYGDGKLNGHFQFNTDFRKTQMCSTMNSFVNNCPAGANSNFRVAPSATTTVATTTAAATTVATSTAAATTAVATTVATTTVAATTVAATTAVATTVAPTTAVATTAVATTPAATTVYVPPHVYHFVVWLVHISNLWWVSQHFADFALALAQSIAEAFGIDISRIHVTNTWGGRRLDDQTSDFNVDINIDDNQGDVTPNTVANNIAKVAPLVNAKLAPKNVHVNNVQLSTGGTTTPPITVTATPASKYASLGKSAVKQAADETQVQPTPLLMLAICLLVIGGVVGVVIRVVKRESHSVGAYVPTRQKDEDDESFLE